MKDTLKVVQELQLNVIPHVPVPEASKAGFPSMTASVLSTDTGTLPGREQCQGRSRGFCRTVHHRCLILRTARHNGAGTKYAQSAASSFPGFFGSFRPRLVPSNPTVKSASTSHLYDRQPPIMTHYSNSPSVASGGRALHHFVDGPNPPRKCLGRPAYELAALDCATSRSFLYSRTANFRAIAALATAVPGRSSTSGSPAAILHPSARPFARLPTARNAAWSFLVC